MRHTGITPALILTIFLVCLSSLVCSKEIHLFYPIHLYKIQTRPKTTGNIENSSKKYNRQPKTRLNYNHQHKMINNENMKEEKRWTRTIFENFWGGSKRYTRGRQAFGS